MLEEDGSAVSLLSTITRLLGKFNENLDLVLMCFKMDNSNKLVS